MRGRSLFLLPLLLAAGRQPVAAQDPTPLPTLTAGAWHSCLLTADSVPQCWGLDVSGQLGREPDGSCVVGKVTWPCGRAPRRFDTGLRLASLTAGEQHTCGLTAQGQAYCWGQNASSQVGTGDSPLAPRSVPILHNRG